MILQRLHELSVRKQLLEDPAFTSRDIACRIDIGANGQFLGLHDLREQIEIPAKSKKGKPKTVLNNGIPKAVPVRPIVWDDKQGRWKATDPAASGKEKPAVFLADTLGRVLPIQRLIPENQRAKFDAQRSTFWRFLMHAIEAASQSRLDALKQFAELIESDESVGERICDEMEKLGLKDSNLCTLALQTEHGKTLLDNQPLGDFWRDFYKSDCDTLQAGQFEGLCQVTGKRAPIADSVKSRVKGLMSIGCRADAYLVTGLDVADSYNLTGAQAAMVSEEGINSFTRAANALISNDLDGKTTSYRIGNVMFVFWTRQDSTSGILNLFEAEPDDVANLLSAVSRGKRPSNAVDDDEFYLLVLSGNSARVVVRDYLETPLANLRDNLARWFTDLRIADLSNDGQGKPRSNFPLWLLAVSTALDSDAVAPDVPNRLMFAAVQGRPIPESVLSSCLRRLRAEGASGFRAARMALIKLILIRQGVPMSETLNDDDKHPAYLYGRLLAVFEQIQYAALGDVNANVVDKFYSVFSAAPALVFNRLFNNAQNHLRKLRGDKPASFVSLDKRLTELVASLPPAPPSGQLSMLDQGRFALGYYHQRAKQFEEIAERKAAKTTTETSA
ncbi:MAG: type I-C CRISPR-associated protein Cas8c/Csd1 [Pirellulaceae bacterium]